ncbi:MFS general substrate transporter [Jaminaea rosea]|uniref:MFS general substrate transporter n=1 Tax=Jaminaea rosea TaxID=1569628 RepID=A0A316V0L6_9BASI|nr:MFS general substrate transporter [Jaminaea rosea]PWN31097.1 MFS general substrate transporter [Jaminaea rosea]
MDGRPSRQLPRVLSSTKEVPPSDSGHGHGDATVTNNSVYSPDEIHRANKRVLLKTDLTVLPLMCVIIMLQYLDKAILSYAALLGLTQDLQLISNEYSWAASIYYFGMLAGLPIWWLLLQRVSLAAVVGGAVSIWGAVAMCHAACHDYSGILAARFFLGFFEAAIVPAFIILVGRAYTKKETISRTAIWYSFNGVALIIGGGVSHGLLTSRSAATASVAIWRQLYLILGGITIFVGLLAAFVVPLDPTRSRLYTERERIAAPYRDTHLAASNIAQETHDYRRMLKDAAEALLDPRLYIIFLGLTLGSIPNGGVTAYSLQLISGFGFPVGQSLLLTLAPGGCQVVSVITFIGVALFTRSRAIGGIVLLAVAIVGAALMYSATVGKAVHMVGYTLLNFGSPAVVALYSFNSAAVGSHGKRVVFAVVAQVAYAAGNIIGPLTFLAQETPVYRTAKIIIIATLCGAALSLALIYGIHTFWNMQRDKAGYPAAVEVQSGQSKNQIKETATPEESGIVQGGAASELQHEPTDFKDKTFRYVL